MSIGVELLLSNQLMCMPSAILKRTDLLLNYVIYAKSCVVALCLPQPKRPSPWGTAVCMNYSTHAEGCILSGSTFRTQQGTKNLVAPEVGTITMEQEAGYFVKNTMIYLLQSTIAVYLICGSWARGKKPTMTMSKRECRIRVYRVILTRYSLSLDD